MATAQKIENTIDIIKRLKTLLEKSNIKVDKLNIALKNTGAVIAGSAIMQSVLIVSEADWKDSDIDIWIPLNTSNANARDTVMEIMKALPDTYRYPLIHSVSNFNGNYARLAKYVSQIFTIKSSLHTHKTIQLMFAKTPILKLIKSFDFLEAQVYYDGKDLYQPSTLNFVRLKDKTLTLSDVACKEQTPYEWIRTLSRIQKYVGRGFSTISVADRKTMANSIKEYIEAHTDFLCREFIRAWVANVYTPRSALVFQPGYDEIKIIFDGEPDEEGDIPEIEISVQCISANSNSSQNSSSQRQSNNGSQGNSQRQSNNGSQGNNQRQSNNGSQVNNNRSNSGPRSPRSYRSLESPSSLGSHRSLGSPRRRRRLRNLLNYPLPLPIPIIDETHTTAAALETCYDLYSLEDIDIEKYTNEDADNIVIIDTTCKNAIGFKRTWLENLLTDAKCIFYPCYNYKVRLSECMVRIYSNNINVVVPLQDVDDAIKTDVKRFKLYKTDITHEFTASHDVAVSHGTMVGADHCQDGTNKLLYRLLPDPLQVGGIVSLVYLKKEGKLGKGRRVHKDKKTDEKYILLNKKRVYLKSIKGTYLRTPIK